MFPRTLVIIFFLFILLILQRVVKATPVKTNARVIAHSVRESYILLSCKINYENLKQEVKE